MANLRFVQGRSKDPGATPRATITFRPLERHPKGARPANSSSAISLLSPGERDGSPDELLKLSIVNVRGLVIWICIVMKAVAQADQLLQLIYVSFVQDNLSSIAGF